MSDRTIGMIQDALREAAKQLISRPDYETMPPAKALGVVLSVMVDQLASKDDREDAAEDASD